MSSSDRLVSDYLDRLESELAGLPRAGRREVLDGIEAHIEEALAALEPGDEAGVRNLLDRVGEPAEIAAEAGDRFGPRRQKTTWREICALILLPFGGLVLPVIGWFAGVVCLWVSDAWTARDKVIGTIVIPGGLFVPFFLLVFVGSSSGSTCIGGSAGQTSCTGGSGTSIWPIVLLGLLVLAPLVSDAYLLWRLRRRLPAASY
jgi:uncharacterized membrane protein